MTAGILQRTVSVFVLLAARCLAAAEVDGWMLDWNEEFSRDGLVDERTWNYEVGFMRNRERQYYVGRRSENCRVEKGRLVLTARKEGWKNDWYFPGNGNWAHQIEYASFTSASITSVRKFGYGRFEIRAKLPARAGAWPALWLLGDTCRRDRDDPTRQDWPACGEIDVAEIWGHHPEKMQGALHSPEGDVSGSLVLESGQSFDDGYHVYALDWQPGRIDMYFDGRKYFSHATDYFSRPMFLLVNLALGGGKNEALVDAAEYPIEMKVDYIRHYVRVSTAPEDRIRLSSPTAGTVVPLLPDCQKTMLAAERHADRLKLLQDDKRASGPLSKASGWRRSRPVALAWTGAKNVTGPWRIRIATDDGLADGVDRYLHDWEVRREGETCRCELSDLNLEVGRRYWWRVSSRGKCDESGCGPYCGCAASRRIAASDIASFETEDIAPRWIMLEGRVGNVRDLGGWTGLDGRTVRQGLVFRGQGLNDNSVNGEVAGRDRLTSNDVRYLHDVLGIRTELDLRNDGETADLSVSPIGSDVRLLKHSSRHYRGVFTEEGKRMMAKNFRVFCRRSNYPIYFHCIGGADRTGALAYMLLGALGVAKEEAEKDWEMTFYPELPEMFEDYSGDNYWRCVQHLESGLMRYGTEDSSWNDRVLAYLADCGITAAEIEKIRSLLMRRRN